MYSIELDHEEYCEGCTEFEPETKYTMLWANGVVHMTEVLVVCEHREKCKAIYRNMTGGTADADILESR